MYVSPSLEEARRLANHPLCKSLPVFWEGYSDMITPIEALKRLKGTGQACFMFESAEKNHQRGRYTFLGVEPKLTLTCNDNCLEIHEAGRSRVLENANPETAIREIMRDYASPKVPGLPPFTGGLVGYFSYEYIKYVEPTLSLKGRNDSQLPDLNLMLFDQVIVFDHNRQKLFLFMHVPCNDLDRQYAQGQARLRALKELLSAPQKAPDFPGHLRSPWEALFSKADYLEKIHAAKAHIFQGNLFQVVLSNRFQARFKGSLLNTYRVLRTTNPSPYMFYLSDNTMEIIGASPETLVKLEEDRLSTFPLAGTRPRGQSVEEDLQLEKELLADEKEKAEHHMLVDLGRNDLGKISCFGSVKVERLMEVTRFSHVMHLASQVSGCLQKDKDALSAIEAVLPAGTLSGAPKIKACEVIDHLEGHKRGPYGGAIGYLDFSGNMDTCIGIRMAYLKNGTAYIQTGAGIVADSQPDMEYQECLQKSQALIQAFQKAEGALL